MNKPEPIRFGIRGTEYISDYWVRWALFDRKEAEDYLLSQGVTHDKEEDDPLVAVEALTGWHRFDRDPGRQFGNYPFMRIYRRKILIRQTGGLDI